MKVFLNEITEQGKDLDFSEADSWVKQAVLNIDEHPEGKESFLSPPASRETPRTIRAHFSIRKVDGVVVISGKIQTHVELMCSRCAGSFAYPCDPTFSALFCKDPVMAGVGYLQKQSNDSREAGRPAGQNHGWARHAHNPEDDDLIAEGKDLDITYLSHDFIDLADVLKEQLQLQIPFQPLCKETCKGICSQCGTDLNQGRCACAKIEKRRPFSVLRDFKI
ncbi:MAG: DUF177 domain-containing protein [Bdellovibrio sp.]|nr:DUF177 domain-containing protein [Bdellovibrio sp.]